jgi:hypothetical protein
MGKAPEHTGAGGDYQGERNGLLVEVPEVALSQEKQNVSHGF